jgi:hypothetical protein
MSRESTNPKASFGCWHAAHPAWAFAAVISGSGDKTCWECNFCERRFTSGGTRLAAHLSHTTGVGIAHCTGGATKESKEAWHVAKKGLEEWKRAKTQKELEKKEVDAQQKLADGTQDAPAAAGGAGPAAAGGAGGAGGRSVEKRPAPAGGGLPQFPPLSQRHPKQQGMCGSLPC